MRLVTPALNFRAIAVPVLIAVIAVGCVQQRPPARTAEQDCYRRISQQPSIYTASDISLALIKVREAQRNIANRAALKTIGEPAAARFPAEAKLAKVEPELTREKAEAEAVNRKLDEIETQAEAGKTQMGECFGIGFSGKQAPNRYARAKEAIAKHRKYAARSLDRVRKRHRDAAERAAFVERWQTENISHLKRKAGNIELEIVEVAKVGFRKSNTFVAIAATNVTSSTILRPRNQRVWGYDVHPKLGGSTPIGTSLSDSFGNTFKLIWVKPRFYRTGGRGIRPGETKVFELEFADMPLENARFVRIFVLPGAYGQSQRAVFDIPAEVFFRGMVGRSQDHP